jgi:hypothetical protein
VLDRGDVYDAAPFTWRDVADDALSVVASGLHDETIDAPTGVKEDAVAGVFAFAGT